MQIIPIMRRGLPALVAVVLGACASSSDSIDKVKIFRLDASQPLRAADPAISFEQRYRLHGAIAAEEVREREGNYYTIFWSVTDPTQPVTLRFEYRQANTGAKVLVIDREIAEPKRHNTTDIAVTGEPFHTQGRVVAWRASLIRGKEVLATRLSYLWE